MWIIVCYLFNIRFIICGKVKIFFNERKKKENDLLILVNSEKNWNKWVCEECGMWLLNMVVDCLCFDEELFMYCIVEVFLLLSNFLNFWKD